MRHFKKDPKIKIISGPELPPYEKKYPSRIRPAPGAHPLDVPYDAKKRLNSSREIGGDLNQDFIDDIISDKERDDRGLEPNNSLKSRKIKQDKKDIAATNYQ